MTILRKSVTLDPGESKAVSFKFTPPIAKAYIVSVNGLTGNFIASEVAVAQFSYVSPLLRWQIGAYDAGWSVDIQNIGDVAGDCELKFCERMMEPGVPCPNWSGLSVRKTYTKTIQPGEVVTFSGVYGVGPYIRQFAVKSPAGVLLNPTLPLEYICWVCAWLYCTDSVSFATMEEFDAHILQEHPEWV